MHLIKSNLHILAVALFASTNAFSFSGSGNFTDFENSEEPEYFEINNSSDKNSGTSFSFSLYKNEYNYTVTQTFDRALSDVVKIYSNEALADTIMDVVSDVKTVKLSDSQYEVHTTGEKAGSTAITVMKCTITKSDTSWIKSCVLTLDKHDTGSLFYYGASKTKCVQITSGQAPKSSCLTASTGKTKKVTAYLFFSRTAQRMAISGAVESLRFVYILWRMAQHQESATIAKSKYMTSMMKKYIDKMYAENSEDAQDNYFSDRKLEIEASDIDGTYDSKTTKL